MIFLWSLITNKIDVDVDIHINVDFGIDINIDIDIDFNLYTYKSDHFHVRITQRGCDRVWEIGRMRGCHLTILSRAPLPAQ